MKTCIRSIVGATPTRRADDPVRPSRASRLPPLTWSKRRRRPSPSPTLRARPLAPTPLFAKKRRAIKLSPSATSVRCMHLGGAVARPLRMIGAMTPAMIAARGVAASAAPARATASARAPGITPGAADPRLARRGGPPPRRAPTRRPLRAQAPPPRRLPPHLRRLQDPPLQRGPPVPSSTPRRRTRWRATPTSPPESSSEKPPSSTATTSPTHPSPSPTSRLSDAVSPSAASVCTRAWWRRCASVPREPTRVAISSASPPEPSPTPRMTTPRAAPSPVAGSRTRRPKTCCSNSCAV